VVLYELLTGTSCFKRRTQAETLAAVVDARHRPAKQLRSGIPAGLEHILSRMLVADRAKRYQSAQALADRLIAYMHATARPRPEELVTYMREVSAEPDVAAPRAFTTTALITMEELQLPGLEDELAEPGPRPWMPERASPAMVAAVFAEDETTKVPAFDESQVPARRSRFKPRLGRGWITTSGEPEPEPEPEEDEG
jgi:hypothetical protein